MPSYDDSKVNQLYRKLVRPWYERALKSLSLYRYGAYLTQDFSLAIGSKIPNQLCYSLPFRGVNMCFKREAIVDAKFPEHPLLRRCVGNEAYLGLQLHQAGFLMIYTPNNPVLHIIHESISRPNLVNKAEVKSEWEIMRKLYRKLLEQPDIDD